MTAVVTPSWLHNKEHNSSMDSNTTTTIGSGSGDGVTGDVDNGMLQTKQHLNSIGEDCTQCTSRPEIEVSGTVFKDLVNNCYADANTCPDNVPIGC